jgi:hypothetical protein
MTLRDSSRSLVPYIGTVPGVVMSCTGPVTGGTVPRTEADGTAYSQFQEEQCLAMGSYHGE